MASNVEPLLDPGTALDRIAAWQEDIDQMVTRTRAMSERLGALRVTASDARRVVELTIDTHGALLDIRFGPRAVQQDPDALARTVMATLGDARRQAAEQTRRIILESIGTDSPAAREIVTHVSAKLGPPSTSPPAAPSSSPSSSPPASPSASPFASPPAAASGSAAPGPALRVQP